MPLTLVVMAAGIGSRYGGLKQLEPVGPGGEAILEYSVHDALAAGFDRVVLVIRRDIERDFRAALGRRIEARVETAYAFQQLDGLPPGRTVPIGRVKPWGTGHAVLSAAPEVPGPFAVVNADDFYGADAYRAIADHLRSTAPRGEPPEHCMAGFLLGGTVSEHGSVSRGVCEVSPDGLLSGIVERTRIERRGPGLAFTEDGGLSWQPLDDRTPVSMNMWGFGPSFLAELETRFDAFLDRSGGDPKAEYFLPSVVMDLLAEGRARVRVLPSPGPWLGVTHREDLEQVRAAVTGLVGRGLYPHPL